MEEYQQNQKGTNGFGYDPILFQKNIIKLLQK